MSYHGVVRTSMSTGLTPTSYEADRQLMVQKRKEKNILNMIRAREQEELENEKLKQENERLEQERLNKDIEHYPFITVQTLSIIEKLIKAKDPTNIKLHLDNLKNYLQQLKANNISVLGDNTKFQINNIGPIYDWVIKNELLKDSYIHFHSKDKILFFSYNINNSTFKSESQDTTSLQGGKNLSNNKAKKVDKKIILGKEKCIYKLPNDRKQYVKYKGEFKTLNDYKALMKK